MALKPLNTTRKITAKSIKLSEIALDTNCLTGDLIDGGTVTNFSSTGIKDTASETQIIVKNGSVEIKKDLDIKGTVRADKLEYVSAQVPKLNVTQAVMVDNNEVIWKDSLGKSVKKSYLQEVGILKDLQVKNTLYVADGRVGINTTAPGADFAVFSNGYEIVTHFHELTGFVGTSAHVPFSIGTDNTPRLTCRANGDVVVGSETGKPVNLNVYGKVGVGVKNPVESLEVSGNIKFSERVFSSGEQEPKSGAWSTGSIVWNEQPALGLPVGWVCIKGGTPGGWRPFGTIN